MRKLVSILAMLAVLLTAESCKNASQRKNSAAVEGRDGAVKPVYAEGFTVTYTDDGCLLDIQDPLREESQSFHYMLVPAGEKPANVPEGYSVLNVPVHRIVCMTSLQLSN
ncbi:MAG: iron ABC transporter substrate-binding protein, partial [Bacteroidales bacterium]|nr:iron ABC transporter substrate-binding protein [Bacteroidales bacterium]